MTEQLLRQYWEIYKAYWDLFRKYTASFGDTNAYWQSLLHEADAIYKTYESVNKDLSYSLALATVKAVEHEWKRANRDNDEGRQMDFYDLNQAQKIS